MRVRHLALSTEQSYLAWLGRYMRFLTLAEEGFPTVRESISDAMSQVEARRLERLQERRRWRELRRVISGTNGGGK